MRSNRPVQTGRDDKGAIRSIHPTRPSLKIKILLEIKIMKDRDYFINSLQNSEASDATKKTYAYNLAWLAKRMPEFDTGTPTPDEVLGYMADNKVKNTRRMHSYTCMKVLHRCKGETTECCAYDTPLKDCKQCVDEEYSKQRRTVHQNKNWVDYACLKKFAQTLRTEAYELDKNGPWTKDQYQRLQLAFVLQVHMTFPLRRDLAGLQWNVEPSDDLNYIQDRNMVWNQFKTAKHLGRITQPMSREMWKLFSLIRKQQRLRGICCGPVLLNRHWKPLSKNSYTGMMIREMKKCPGCEDKCISVSLLRHCVISHKTKSNASLEERNSFARNCMHSSARNELYRVY